MKMYVWESEAFRNWGNGTIVVIASDVIQAKERAWIEFTKHVRATKDWWFNVDGTLEKDSYDDHASLCTLFGTDLNQEPKCVEVLIIPGSN